MKPLQWIAMGLLIIVLYARFGGYDVYVDPLGWLLVLLGTRELRDDLPRRSVVVRLAVLAAVVSVPLWLPVVTDLLDAADPALAWAANLPRFAYVALLCHTLAITAAEAGDRRAAGWLRIVRLGVMVVALLPVLVFGAGLRDLGPTSALAAQVVSLVVIWLLFTYSGRPWAGAAISETSARRPTIS